MATATATMPAPSTTISTARSLTATKFCGPAWPAAARRAGQAAARRCTVITSRMPRMTSSATPMAVRSRHNGPFQCGPVTAPRNPGQPEDDQQRERQHRRPVRPFPDLDWVSRCVRRGRGHSTSSSRRLVLVSSMSSSPPPDRMVLVAYRVKPLISP